jgi:hypothetical protein
MNRALVARDEGWMFLVHDTGDGGLFIRMQRDGAAFMDARLTADQVEALRALFGQGAPGR